jgi:hypothetical protein
MLALTILNTLNFASFSYFKTMWGVSHDRIAAGQEFESRLIVTGLCVGFVSSWVSTPFELLKTQMQTQVNIVSLFMVFFYSSSNLINLSASL